MTRSRPCRILLVDDSSLFRGLIALYLVEAGYDVLEACDGEEAKRLLNDRGAVDLLVTDYQMPGMSGVQLATWFQKMHPAVPVLLVSGFPDHVAMASSALPRAACHVKPAHPDDLLKIVATLIPISRHENN